MTASQYIKAQGLPTLQYVADKAHVSRELLYSWHDNRPSVFEYLIKGIAADMSDEADKRREAIKLLDQAKELIR